MWKRLQTGYPTDKDYAPRVARISALQRVLNGTMYDQLKYAFNEEMNGANEYIKLHERRPCVRYNICRLAVGQSAAMLFSEGHFPEIEHPAEETKKNLAKIIEDICLNLTMIDAAKRGSVGSIVLWLRVLEGCIFIDVLDTTFLTPDWNPKRPDQLLNVTERYKVKGKALRDMGYTIKDDDLNAPHWWQRIWTDQSEEWYVPQKIVKDKPERAPKPMRLDDKRTVDHGLGFVPVVWIKNLPGGDDVDGAPTFCDEAIDTQIECDYQLSQGSRALRYAGDPLLLVKEPAAEGGPLVRSAANAMVVSKDGDAKLVEIDGAASEAVVNYVKYMRDLALEQLHASRVNPEKLSAAQSGRAMELLNQPLIWLADQLRVTYGQFGLIQLLQMIVKVGASSQLMARDGTPYAKLAAGPVSLKWPPWYAPTASDLSNSANTLRTHTDAGHMSQETAVNIVAQQYDIQDPAEELKRIKADQAELAKLNPQVKENITA